MMKGMLKRALGVVAAAAMAVTGMTALAGTANAASGDVASGEVNFTFTASSQEQLQGRTIEAYQIGRYVEYTHGGTTVYGVESANDEATLTDAVNDAYDGEDVPNGEDPMTWAAQQGLFDQSTARPWTDKDSVGGASMSREFANYLATHKGSLTKYKVSDQDPQLSDPSGSESSWSSTLTLPAGVWLIVDTTPENDEITQAVPMIVYSGTLSTATDNVTKFITNPDQPGVGSTVIFKNTKSGLPTKTGDKSTVSVGDTITYTLQYTIPNPAPAAFQFNDVPGVGLTVNFGNGNIVVKADGADLQEGVAPSEGTPATEDYYVTNGLTDNGQGEYQGNGESMFSVVLNDPGALAGKLVTVTYKATVNPSAVSDATLSDGIHSVVNKLVGNNGEPEYSSYESKLYSFTFTKTKADGTALGGATFTISGTTLPAGYAGGSNNNATSTSDANGLVTFKGLAAGTYTVSETGVPTGFMQNVKPTFTVMIGAQGQIDVSETDAWGLVDSTNKADIKVKNVENITQLPMTGAAGIAMFAVVAVLVAGAGLALYGRSRKAAAALRA